METTAPEFVTIYTTHEDGTETVEVSRVITITSTDDLVEFLRELEGVSFTFDTEEA